MKDSNTNSGEILHDSRSQSFRRDSCAVFAIRFDYLVIFFLVMGKSRIIRSISPRYTAQASKRKRKKKCDSHEFRRFHIRAVN